MLKPKAANRQNRTINARHELSSAHDQSEVKKGNTLFAQGNSKRGVIDVSEMVR
jgi:hypothetical protein